MTGRRVVEHARCRIEDAVAHGREIRGARGRDECVQPREELAWRFRISRQRRQRRAHLAHRRSRGQSVADNVADRQRDLTVRKLENVVPVSADLERRACRLITSRDRHATRDDQRPG